jgi:hypothetical protein
MSKRRMFRSREGYRKWLAYGHMRTRSGRMLKYPATKTRSMMARSKTNPEIYIRGKYHKVRHL